MKSDQAKSIRSDRSLRKLYKSKLFMSVFIVGVLIMFVSAGWYFGYSKTLTGTIIGEGEILIIDLDLSDFELNASSSENTQLLSLTNNDGNRLMVFNKSVDSNLTEIGCPDFENDCVVEFSNETNIFDEGDDLYLQEGTSEFNLTTTCDINSCSQDLTISISMIEK